MTPAEIIADIEAAYSDWTGHAVPHLTDLVPLAIATGIEQDADVVFLATVIDSRVHCGLICGCAFLVPMLTMTAAAGLMGLFTGVDAILALL